MTWSYFFDPVMTLAVERVVVKTCSKMLASKHGAGRATRLGYKTGEPQ